MKTFFYSFISIIISIKMYNVQEVNEVYLSYNIIESKVITKKYIDDKGSLNFYIGNEHFISNLAPKKINKNDLKCESLLDVKTLISISNKKRKELIKAGHKSGKIKMLNNSDVFKVIYLYEKKEDKIYIYKVKWVDEIMN